MLNSLTGHRAIMRILGESLHWLINKAWHVHDMSAMLAVLVPVRATWPVVKLCLLAAWWTFWLDAAAAARHDRSRATAAAAAGARAARLAAATRQPATVNSHQHIRCCKDQHGNVCLWLFIPKVTGISVPGLSLRNAAAAPCVCAHVPAHVA